MTPPAPLKGWHFDKRVPIALIGVVLFHLALSVWFLSKMDSRVATLEVARVEQVAAAAIAKAEQHERDAQQDKASSESDALIRGQLVRMDDKMDRILAGMSRWGR